MVSRASGIKSVGGFLPLVDSAPLVPQGDSDCSGLVQAEVLAVVVIVGRDPAHPYQRRVLASKHPYRMVVLQSNMHKKEKNKLTGCNKETNTMTHFVTCTTYC